MRARAPGKVVISGAYSVLEGAPAVVSAVSRYVVADAAREADFVTPEVRVAIGGARAPWFDASALRGPRGKLGLGSSAAILVASLAALALEQGELGDDDLCDAVLDRALDAHRKAQGGGSGIDVAASARGGTLLATRRNVGLDLVSVALPSSLFIEIWTAGEPASTPALIGAVRVLRERDARLFAELMNDLCESAEAAARALQTGDAAAFVKCLDAQRQGLARLGGAATAPIVTAVVAELAEQASREGAVVLPSGAGGGDVALYVGLRSPSPELVDLRVRLEHDRLDASLGARGVHVESMIDNPAVL